MNALCRIIEQSRRILEDNATGKTGSTTLIACDIGSIETVFEESTEFDLVDRICRSSVFFQAVDPTSANLRRMRAYDRMLVRCDLQPAFLDLDEATSLRVGNELSRFLTARIGRENTLKLLDGKETLARMGLLKDDLEDQISTKEPIRLIRAERAVIEAKPVDPKV